MKYYLHDSNSFHDEKIYKLYMEFGYEGLGVFYTFLEKIAQQEKPVNEEVIKKQLNIRKRLSKVWDFMKQIGLISIKNGEVFNENLINFAESYQIKKEKTRKKVSEWRDKQKDSEDVTDYVPVSNPPKVKLSKVKESNINILKNESEIWLEDICMKKSYAMPDVRKHLNDFVADQELKGEMDRPINEIRSHFINYLRVYLTKSDEKKPKTYQQWLDGLPHNKEKLEKYNQYLKDF